MPKVTALPRAPNAQMDPRSLQSSRTATARRRTNARRANNDVRQEAPKPKRGERSRSTAALGEELVVPYEPSTDEPAAAGGETLAKRFGDGAAGNRGSVAEQLDYLAEQLD